MGIMGTWYVRYRDKNFSSPIIVGMFSRLSGRSDHKVPQYPRRSKRNLLDIATTQTISWSDLGAARGFLVRKNTSRDSMSVPESKYVNVPTSEVSHRPSDHCDLRGKQRGISVDDLKRAKKYGVKSPGKWPGTVQYVHEDVTYLVEKKTGRAVTAWAKPIPLKPVKISATSRTDDAQAHYDLISRQVEWTSHSVFVVDTSGSMRESDIWGTRSRLCAVWLCLARDYIAQGLNSGEKGATDAVSVVTLGETPTNPVTREPWSWTLYNKIVTFYRSNQIRAESHGPFLPALKRARKVLMKNDSPSQASALYFLSDGAPSDTSLGSREERDQAISQSVKDIACIFGRRLTFFAVGIGASENFETLQKMVDAAKDFGVRAEFLLPSMTADSLGLTISSALTSLTRTQADMTDVDTLRQRSVRLIRREGKSEASKDIVEVSSTDFWLYPKTKVVRSVYREWFEGRAKKESFEGVPLQNEDACFVAISKRAFDEGGERVAFRFYEVAADGTTIIGKPMVAKESLYVLENENTDRYAREAFVRKYCSTQQLARRLATEFNDVLDSTHRVARGTPRVAVLDCSIYELDDNIRGKQWMLVEDRLDVTKWHKWNCNNGFVEGMTEKPVFDKGQIRSAIRNIATLDLGMIEEEDEEEEDTDDDEEDDDDASTAPNGLRKILFTPSQVAQAFSHFTYWNTKRKRLVCDLQGVFEEATNTLVLSDPVIHYHNPEKKDRRRVHGATDKGAEGVVMFFETHKDHCNHLCKLTTRRLRPHRPHGRPHHRSRVGTD